LYSQKSIMPAIGKLRLPANQFDSIISMFKFSYIKTNWLSSNRSYL